jgi:predicted O-linked N-acetylglucosamine transferase (SPINDLY family)
LGITLQEMGRLQEAETSYRQAIVLKPDHANAHSNLGALLDILKKPDEALKSYECALALEPDTDYLLGAVLFARVRLCIWDGLPQSLIELTRRINKGERASAPFPLHGLIDSPDLHGKAAGITSKHKYPRLDILPKISPYTGHKKIRVGYFSPDFRNHPVSILTAELYERHDRARFEVHAFSFGKDSDDEWALRIKAGVDHFHDVCAMSDEDVAMLSRSVELDIAVDLTGLTQGCRPGIFAMSAAPIQLGYLGFLGTMGADYYDYLISDKMMIPECNKQYYAESIVYLPSFQVNSLQNYTQDTLLDRGYFNIPEDVFVFLLFQ